MDGPLMEPDAYPCGRNKGVVDWINLEPVRAAIHVKPEAFYGHAFSLEVSSIPAVFCCSSLSPPPPPSDAPHTVWHPRAGRPLAELRRRPRSPHRQLPDLDRQVPHAYL